MRARKALAWTPVPRRREVPRNPGQSRASRARALHDRRCSVDEIAAWLGWTREEVRQALRRQP